MLLEQKRKSCPTGYTGRKGNEMNVISKAEKSRLEWLAKNVVSIHMGRSKFWDLSISETQEERETTEKKATRAISALERGLITNQECVSLLCGLAD